MMQSSIANLENRSFTIIIPAYNEKDRISGVLEEIGGYIESNGLRWNVIVSIDGDDRTETIVRKYSEKHEFIKYNKQNGRDGKGNAIKRVLKEATGDYVILMDSDGALPLSSMLSSIPLTDSYQVINFDRYTDRDNHIPFLRRLASRGYNIYIKALLGIGVNDTQCGYKIIKKEVAKEIFSKVTISNGFFYAPLFYYLKRMNVSVKEVPVVYSHTEGSKFNLASMIASGFISAFFFRIRHSRFFKYVPGWAVELYYRKFRWI